jgi:glutamate synthase domain-containing protein 3
LFSVDYSNGRRLTSRNKFGEEISLRYDADLSRPAERPDLPSTLDGLTRALDIPCMTDGIPRKWYLSEAKQAINEWLDRAPWTRVTFESRGRLQPPQRGGARFIAPEGAINGAPTETLVIDARGFAAEGRDSLSLFIVRAYELGWRDVIAYRCRGHRFLGCGLHEKSDGFRLQVYGSSGDYLASGLDGAEVIVHGNGQDQLGQIFHRGKLVVYGDVGQTFFYGAKGGEAFIMGNAAGRPLINAVGSPRVVINGTCLDYLGESFMAGDPLKGGGFVILNGVRWNDRACIEDLPTPYPGSNLFSLASGGAIYVRDPRCLLEKDQLNGGEFAEITEEDWKLIEPYLLENQRLFHISVEHDLLRGESPEDVYRKIRPAKSDALH